MPYANDYMGIYRVYDTITGTCYVGQSRRLRKRISEHFRLLRRNIHPNPHIQNVFNKSGAEAFRAEVEVVCEDPNDMDAIEEAFLQGDAVFVASPRLLNISSTARAPMSGRKHTDETKAQLSRAKRGRTDHVTPEYRKKLSDAHRRRALSDPEYRAKVEYIVNNPHLSYAERGRVVGISTSTTRKLALKYTSLKET